MLYQSVLPEISESSRKLHSSVLTVVATQDCKTCHFQLGPCPMWASHSRAGLPCSQYECDILYLLTGSWYCIASCWDSCPYPGLNLDIFFEYVSVFINARSLAFWYCGVFTTCSVTAVRAILTYFNGIYPVVILILVVLKKALFSLWATALFSPTLCADGMMS